MGSLQISLETFWVLPLTYLYLPKSARAYLFPQSVKIHYFCSGPIRVDPICPQPRGEKAHASLGRVARRRRRPVEDAVPNLPTNIAPSKIARVKLSGKFHMGLGIPPLKMKIMLESNPLKSIMLVEKLGVVPPVSGELPEPPALHGGALALPTQLMLMLRCSGIVARICYKHLPSTAG